MVYVHRDIADNLERAWSGEGSPEDINVAYVAVTRPSERVHLFEGFKKILTPAWQQMMERLDNRAGIKTRLKTIRATMLELAQERGKIPSSRKSVSRPARKSSTKAGPPEAKVRIGDRVKTPLGEGEVIEIRSKECLVALDNGPAKVWRPISTVV